MKKLLSLGTDRLLFRDGSAVRERVSDYAKGWDEVHVVVSTDRSFSETAIGKNVWVYPTRSRFKAVYPLDMRRLGSFIGKRRGITHVTCQDPFFTAMAGIALKKELGAELEIQVHTDIGSPNYPRTLANRFRKALALSYLPKADRIRVVSERIKRYLTDELGILPERIEVRPIAVDTERIKGAPITVDLHKKYPQFDRIALMASRLTEEKNIELALRGFQIALSSHPKAGLVIVGSGPKAEELKGLAAKIGISASVVFEGWADQATLASYYKTADLFLSTSLFEGYGMTFVEAKAADCPIVSTDVGVALEMGAQMVDYDPASVGEAVSAML